MNDPIAILRKDHREAESLIKKLEATSKPSARRNQTVKKLVEALTLHMKIEETLVYPVAAKTLDQEPVKEAYIEHGLARDGLKKLVELQAKPGFGAAVDMVKAGIKHHVKEEETEMFPKLKKKLDRDSLLDLGDAVAAAKKKK